MKKFQNGKMVKMVMEIAFRQMAILLSQGAALRKSN